MTAREQWMGEQHRGARRLAEPAAGWPPDGSLVVVGPARADGGAPVRTDADRPSPSRRCPTWCSRSPAPSSAAGGRPSRRPCSGTLALNYWFTEPRAHPRHRATHATSRRCWSSSSPRSRWRPSWTPPRGDAIARGRRGRGEHARHAQPHRPRRRVRRPRPARPGPRHLRRQSAELVEDDAERQRRGHCRAGRRRDAGWCCAGGVLDAGRARVLVAFASHLGVLREREELARQTEAARELEAGNRTRTALLAAVSHDLRTPLAGIRSAAETLRDARRRARPPRTGPRCSTPSCSRPPGSPRWSATCST